MKTKIKLALTTTLTILLATLVPLTAFAQNCSDKVCTGNYPESVKAACGCSGSSNGTELKSSIESILNSIIAVIGIVAVIFIIVGGVNYMTSSGDAGKIEKAKKTILYACIGLIICALAFAIVNFVITNLLK